MSDNVIFHALEKNKEFEEQDKLLIGNNVTYGNRAIVHGGLAQDPRVFSKVKEDLPPTKIGNNVSLEQDSVVFRSTIEDGFRIGAKSLIVNANVTSALQGITGKTIPPKSIVTTVLPSDGQLVTRLIPNGIEW
jgi:carbonic anhydrase/acetyltransferase-like protein (isoleucine patch superfamily)